MFKWSGKKIAIMEQSVKNAFIQKKTKSDLGLLCWHMLFLPELFGSVTRRVNRFCHESTWNVLAILIKPRSQSSLCCPPGIPLDSQLF